MSAIFATISSFVASFLDQPMIAAVDHKVIVLDSKNREESMYQLMQDFGF